MATGTRGWHVPNTIWPASRPPPATESLVYDSRMDEVEAARPVVAFGEFRFDRRSGELWKKCKPVKLHPKPAELLALLIDRAEHIVTREEIQDKLWDAGTFVDFDLGINSCIRQIRTALEDDAERPRFVQTFPRRGYRFVAPILSAAELGAASNQPAAPARKRRGVYAFMALGVVAALAVIAALNVEKRDFFSRGGNATEPVESIAVLPFNNLSGDPAQDYFADGMTEALITHLAKIRALRVISSRSVLQFRGTDTSLQEVAERLNVDAVIEGAVLRSGDRVRITAQLVRVSPEKHLWAESYERDLQDILKLQSKLSREIARAINITVTSEEWPRLETARRIRPAVHEAYLKGRSHWNKQTPGDLETAVERFEEAVAIDPEFAVAYAWLSQSVAVIGGLAGDTFRPREAMERAERAARKSLDIDPGLAEGYGSLGFVLSLYNWDWSGAEAALRQAVELNPGFSLARLWLAAHLSRMGRHDEALAEVGRAENLDPLNLRIRTTHGTLLYDARRYDEAVDQLETTLMLGPDYRPAHRILGLAYLGKKKYDKAIEEHEKAVELSGRSCSELSFLGAAYAAAGRRAEAVKTLEELEDRATRQYVPAFARIWTLLQLGDTDRTFVWLEKAFDERSPFLAFLKVHPLFDPVRSDPRFQSLLRRMDFPE